ITDRIFFQYLFSIFCINFELNYSERSQILNERAVVLLAVVSDVVHPVLLRAYLVIVDFI
ncbi:hypothetical protein QN379_18520, partial [Glaciimonas sp. Gout2]|uniref:hypothetical protein n=1 Tax=Glaciimonas sp. Gout2 TaxID=3048625 RepID=UPI002B2355E2